MDLLWTFNCSEVGTFGSTSCWDLGHYQKTMWSLAFSAIQCGHVAKFKLLKTAFIALLPKKKIDAIQVKDYRSISLIQILLSWLAHRLAPLLPGMVSINQSAFIKGRSIQDNCLLVQQVARKLHSKKEPHVLFKLDISKAFDSLDWSFLIEVLKYLGFGRWYCNLLCLPLSTSSTGALINREPGQITLHLRSLHPHVFF